MGSAGSSKSDGVTDEVLAGEYVLGVLPADRRILVEERLRADRSFASMVNRWRENLATSHEEELRFADALMRLSTPDQRLLNSQRRETGVCAALWNSVAFWRIATVWSVLAALMLSLAQSYP